MYSNILALTSFLSLVAAVPHNHKGAHLGAPHHKRAEIIHWDVETVMTTVTQWLPAGDPRFEAQSTQGLGGDESSYHRYGSPAETSAASSTTSTTSTTSSSSSVAGSATSASAAYIPVSSAQSASATFSAISDQQAAVVPVASTTSSTTSSSTSSTTPTQAATTEAAYVAPPPVPSTSLSSSAPPASSSAASSSSESGSGTASYLNGHCSGPGNTCSGDITTYTAGTGTCGFADSDADFIVALSRQSWQAVNARTDYMTGNMLCSFCSKKISISLNGVTQIGTIRDKCDGNQCANVTMNHAYDIDLSTALFKAIGGTDARGRYSPSANGGNDEISWYFL